MAIPVDIQKKIDAVKDMRGHLKHYCHYSPQDHCTYEKVCCKLCGCTIRSLVPHEKTGNLILVNCPNYTIVTLEFDDGSAHETPLCKQCALTLTDDDREQIYAQDLLQTGTDPGEVGTESLPTSLSGELERIRFTIEEFKSTFDSSVAQWYETVTVSDISLDSASIMLATQVFS